MGHSSLVHLLVLLLCALVSLVHSHSFVSLTDSASDSASTSDSGSGEDTVDIYNVCPVLVKFTEEQELLSERELKAKAADAAMSAYLMSHPNNTLWDFFKLERKQRKAMFKTLSTREKAKKVFKWLVDFVSETTIGVAQMIADAIEWVVHTFNHPHVGMHQVAEFFHQFGQNVMTMRGLLMKDQNRTLENVGGGTLLYIRHHPADFASAAIVLAGGGIASVRGLFMGVEAVFGTIGKTITEVMGLMMFFMHAIDLPVLLVTPFISSFVKTAQILTGGENATANATTLTFDAIQPLDSCLIPEGYRPTFSSRDLCLSSPAEVRTLLFGTAKRSIYMDDSERIHAYNHFHDFVCCYLADREFEVHAPNISDTEFKATLVPYPVKMTDCDKLIGIHNDNTVWQSTYGSGSMEEL